jgi:hypothetical protein
LLETHATRASDDVTMKVENLSSSTSANRRYLQDLYQIETQLHSFVTWEKHDEDKSEQMRRNWPGKIEFLKQS